jgi:predicted enzyme related to lactoylglutathione lyase
MSSEWVVHFELHALDTERAVKFYQEVFAWQGERWSGDEDYYYMRTRSGDGIDGGIMKSKDQQPRTVNTIEVTCVDEFSEKVVQHGGKVVVPKFELPGIGHMAYCTDTEGNIFGIFKGIEK